MRSPEIANVTATNGEIIVTGAAAVNGLFVDENGKPFSRKAEIPFEHKIPMNGNGKVNVTVVPKCANVKIVGGAELLCETEVVFSVYEEKVYLRRLWIYL